MAILKEDQRVGIFVDVQNIYHSAKNLFNSRVNFDYLVKLALNERKLIRAIAYVVKSEAVLGETAFFEALKKAGLELRIKDLQVYPDGVKKADWDVGLTVDTIRLANSLDVVVLVSGDGDFLPLVDYLKIGLGKKVEVLAFLKTASLKLKEAADLFIDLAKEPKIFLKIKKYKRV